MNLLTFAMSILIGIRVATGAASVPLSSDMAVLGTQERELAQKSFSLEKRYDDKFVNDVFKDNILLTLAYMDGRVKSAPDISWEAIEKPGQFTLSLNPGEVFAFHQDVLPAYKGKTIKTMNAHFNAQDGFKFSGLYYGDGVCHLASLIYWAAKDAGLAVERPANHDFAVINEVPKEYGTSIFYMPGNESGNAHQNLYVENNQNKTIRFVFTYNGETLQVRIVE